MERFRDKKIGVLMGGLSAERDISLKSGGAVLNSLLKQGYNAVGIDADRELDSKLTVTGVEVAFIALHGKYGEDGVVQGVLELKGIPYTGSGVAASGLAMNKVTTKRFFQALHIPTPTFAALQMNGAGKTPSSDVALPVIVKPAMEGSTIGITVVKEKALLKGAIEGAFEHSGLVLVEQFITGKEVTVSVIDGEPLPPIEIRPKEGFYDYKAKYTAGETAYLIPTTLGERREEEYKRIALDAYRGIGCRGAARVDMMVDGAERPWVLEINTIPGFTETSLLPKAAAACGISFDDLVEKILSGARLGD